MPKIPPTPLPAARTADAACRFPRDPASPGRARSVLRQQLAACRVTGEAAHSAELVLSELVTNAYRHAHIPGQIGVRVSIQGGALNLEVSDADDTPPRPCATTADDDICGRGLTLVDALADDWGVLPRPFGIGKTIWAVIKVPTPPGSAC